MNVIKTKTYNVLGDKKMKEQMLKFIKENDRSIKVFIFLFILGLATGVICFKYINIASNNEFINSFNNTLEIVKKEDFLKISIFTNAIINILVTYSFIVISSITIIAPFILFIIYFLKGFSIGILINILLTIFGFNQGLLLILLMVIIPNILSLSTLIFLGIKTIDFNYFILEKHDLKKIIKQSIVYSMYFVLSSPIMLLSVFIEQLTLPLLIS